MIKNGWGCLPWAAGPHQQQENDLSLLEDQAEGRSIVLSALF